MDVEQIQWDALKDELTGIISDSVQSLVEGASGDVHSFAAAMALDTTKALRLPSGRREPVLEEIVAQTKLVAELNRIRAVNETWHVVQQVVAVVQRTASAVLAAAI